MEHQCLQCEHSLGQYVMFQKRIIVLDEGQKSASFAKKYDKKVTFGLLDFGLSVAFIVSLSY